MGDELDAEGNLYYKKLEVDDIVYNPCTWDIAIVLSWKNNEVRVVRIMTIESVYGAPFVSMS